MPHEWGLASDATFFNNAIHIHGDQVLMAFRVVNLQGQRRIAICRLGRDYAIVPGSATALSDHFRYADEAYAATDRSQWSADARLFSAGERLFMHFNTGSNPKPNKIFLVELCPKTLLPLSAVREIVAPTLKRQKVEKNWIFFSNESGIFAVYSFCPLIILRVDLSDDKFVYCEPAYKHTWDAHTYTQTYGELRGGASPVRRDSKLYFVLHSLFSAAGTELAKWPKDLCYVAPVVALEDKPPFRPLALTERPLIELSPQERELEVKTRLHERVIEVVYCCGAIEDAESIVISYGVNNHYMALRSFSFRHVDEVMSPIVSQAV